MDTKRKEKLHFERKMLFNGSLVEAGIPKYILELTDRSDGKYEVLKNISNIAREDNRI